MSNKKLFFLLGIIYINFNYGYSAKLKCFSCSGENSDCAQQPNKIKAIECSSDDSKCYILNNGNGMNQRGCTYSLHMKCVNNTECITCDTDSCNTDIFPQDRHRCYHCTNGENCLNNNNSLPCISYKNSNDNQCYTVTEEKNIIQRGCFADYVHFCNSNLKNCQKCEGTNCNNKNINDTETTTIEPPEVTITTESSNSTSFNQTCYRCRSDIDKFCSNSLVGLNQIKPMKCVKETEHSNNFGCYIRKLDTRVLRGCLIDLDEDVRKICEDKDIGSCLTCYTNDCNGGKAPNSSTTINNKFLSLLLCFIVLLNILLK